jgi:phosphohistidine phosphatase
MDIVADERLYGADLSEWLEIIQGFDDALDRVMCVGHNPGLTELASYLSSEGIGHVPTCGVVELRFGVWRWALIGRVEPTGVDFDYPKRVIS